MIQISGMEDGSGGGMAAGRKAGWLPRGYTPLPAGAPPLQRAVNPRLSLPPVFQPAPAAPPPVPRPVVGPDGRPLPPDGSTPPSRPATRPASPTPPEATAGRRQSPASPRPPDGSPPPRRTAPITRIPGTPLPPGEGPAAPAGHTFEARPVPAPPGEFLFDVRCSCGASGRAAVPAAALLAAAAQGQPAAAAIAIATQDALDAMHRA